jgi:hypothetical protein
MRGLLLIGWVQEAQMAPHALRMEDEENATPISILDIVVLKLLSVMKTFSRPNISMTLQS